MAKRQTSARKFRSAANQRRSRPSFAEALSLANRRAHEQANRRSGKRGLRSVQAAIADARMDEPEETADWIMRIFRWLVGLALLPVCWVTLWTFLSRFSRATVEQGFWQTAEFWYFATGVLLMAGWFWSGLLRTFFLYLYVLGHELTHAVSVVCFRGRITDFHVSAEGGYITTNKTNLFIALSPYFVPFWSVVIVVVYGAVRVFSASSQALDLAFYGLLGATWWFHLMWTLWMLPRDQPDLKEHGTFLSLVVILQANVVILAGLLCVAEGSPLKNCRDFAVEWLRHAATWGDIIWRWSAAKIVILLDGGWI